VTSRNGNRARGRLLGATAADFRLSAARLLSVAEVAVRQQLATLEASLSTIAANTFINSVLWWGRVTPTDRVLIVTAAALASGAALVLTRSVIAVGMLSLVVALAVLFRRRPWLALYGMLLVSPFYFMWNSLLTSGQLGFMTKISPVDVLAGLSLVYAVLALSQTRARPKPNVIDLACLLWVVLSFLALSRGVFEGYEAALRSSRGPLLWALYFPAVLHIASDKRRRQVTWRVVLAAAALIGVVDLMASVGLLSRAFPSLPVGLVGGFIRPNFFGDPVLMIPGIVLVLVLLAVGRWSSRQRWSFRALAALDLAVLMISATRGFWLGMFVALIVLIALLAWKKRLTKRAFAVGVLGSVGAAALVEIVVFVWRRTSLVGALVERVQTLVTGDPRSVNVRLAETAAYIESFIEAPVFGNGYGAPVHFGSVGETVGFAHNQYAFVLQTTGLVGFCALGALLVLVVWRSIRVIRTARSLTEAHVSHVVAAATFIGFGVTSFISPEFTNVTTVPLLAVTAALVRAESRPAHGSSRPYE
jgi:O-antigen ligase